MQSVYIIKEVRDVICEVKQSEASVVRRKRDLCCLEEEESYDLYMPRAGTFGYLSAQNHNHI